MQAIAWVLFAGALMAQPSPQGPPPDRGPGRGRPAREAVADPNQKPGRVEGRVVHAKTGEPLRKATVTLNLRGPRGGSARSITTEADGRFAFETVTPGTYELAAERTGYLRQSYTPPGPGRASSSLSVASGQNLTGLEIKLMPHAVVAGKVLDADGEPMQGAVVSVMRVNSLGGRMRAAPVESEVSNDLGEFRVYRLPPGRYYLAASRSRRMGPEERGSGGQRESYVTTYYPGSTDLAGATLLQLAAGQEVNGLTIQLRRSPVFTVRGKVVNMPANSRPQSLRVFLRPGERDAVQMMSPGGSGGVSSDGAFQIDGVQPGHYLLAALLTEREPVTLGSLQLTVGASNVEDIAFPLSEPVTVMGSVRMENGDPATNAASARVLLAMTNPMFGGRKEAALKDGTFRMERVSREPAYVTMSGLPSGLWVRSVKMGNRELPGGLVDLSGSALLAPLEIILSDKVGAVEGTASADGQPAAGGWVSLVPEPYPVGRADLVRVANIGDGGAFRLEGVPPGEYRVFAWEEEARDSFGDPELLKKFEGASVKVSVKENATERVELKLVRNDQP